MSKRKFNFYHADRMNTLTPRTTLIPNGLYSRFGEFYVNRMHSNDINIISDPNVQREMIAEDIRQKRFPMHPSRLSCLFAANTIDDACRFALHVVPKPNYPIKIFEVFAENFTVLDMKWLDFDVDTIKKMSYVEQYWYSSITQHKPDQGDRSLPMLEVLLPLPVEIGDVVKVVAPE
uniref:DUF2441 domain-containing protein n=1 Tax=Serratia quinivorans TaxID=137545 RepID=UPI0035C7652D